MIELLTKFFLVSPLFVVLICSLALSFELNQSNKDKKNIFALSSVVALSLISSYWFIPKLIELI